MLKTQIPITISGKNIRVTPALEEHASNKLEKTLRRFDAHQAVRADVVLRTQKRGQIAEITVMIGGYFLRGESASPDMYYSINEAVSRIEGQLRKFKAKTSRKSNGNGKYAGIFPDTVREYQDTPIIAKKKSFVLKPMSEEEAVLQMELLGHDFFIFTRDDNFEVNVLYRRKDGNYGLIEPIVG